MVFYGGEPRLGTLEEQELGRGGRGEGGRGRGRLGGEGWEGPPTRDNSSVCFYDEMKSACLRRRAAVCADLLLWRKSRRDHGEEP